MRISPDAEFADNSVLSLGPALRTSALVKSCSDHLLTADAQRTACRKPSLQLPLGFGGQIPPVHMEDARERNLSDRDTNDTSTVAAFQVADRQTDHTLISVRQQKKFVLQAAV